MPKFIVYADNYIDVITGRCRVLKEVTEEYTFEELLAKQWIPVSERLPELDMTKPDECICLVWYDNEVGYGLGYYTNESIFSPNAIGEPHWIIPRFSNVIAWCRLPEPYKSDEKTT